MAEEPPQDSAGPSSPPPRLPEGWLAQWEGVLRRWYFVQRATGKSQWEIPTEPVSLTPSTTPNSIGTGPTNMPQLPPQPINPTGFGEEQSRAFGLDKTGLTKMFNSQIGTRSGGLGQMAVGMLNKLSNQLFNDKPSSQIQNTQAGQYGSGYPLHTPAAPYPQYQHSYYGQHSQSNPYGYPSTGHLGTYSGPAPQYNPPSQTPIYSPTGQVPPPAYAATTSQYNLTSQPTEYHPPSQSSASATFPGSTPQYNTPGQTPVPPGQNHPPNGNTYPSQDGYTASFGPDSHISSPFNQSSPLLVHTGESSTNISTTNQYTSPTSSTPSVNQPEWQIGSQPAIPQSTKPTHGHPHQSATSSPAQSGVGQYASQQAGYHPQQYAQGQPYPPSQYSGVPSSNHTGPVGGDQHFQQPPPSQSIPQYGQPPQADIPVHGTTPGFHGSPLSANAPTQPVPYGSHPHYSVNPQYPQPYQVPTQGPSFPATHPPAPPANAPIYASNPTMRQGPPDSAQPYPVYGGRYPIGNQPTNNRQEGSNSGQHNPHSFAVELADTSVSPSNSRPPTQLSNSSKAETSSNSYAGNFNTQQSPAHPPELEGDKNETLYNSGAPHAPTTPASGPPPSQNPAMPDSQLLSGNWASTMPSGTGQHLQPNSQPPYGFNYASGYGS